MEVEVIDALAGLRSLVEDESIAVPIHFALVGDTVRHLHHPRQHRGLVAGEIVDGGNVHFRDDEHVGWRHRPDVLEGDDVVLAEDFFRGNLPREDLAEQAVLSHRHSLRAEETVPAAGDRKSTRLNSSHMSISYAVFCLKKKKKKIYLICLERKKKKLKLT